MTEFYATVHSNPIMARLVSTPLGRVLGGGGNYSQSLIARQTRITSCSMDHFVWCNLHTLGRSIIMRDYIFYHFSQGPINKQFTINKHLSNSCIGNIIPFQEIIAKSNNKGRLVPYSGHWIQTSFHSFNLLKCRLLKILNAVS